MGESVPSLFRYPDQPHAKTCQEVHRNIADFVFKTEKVCHWVRMKEAVVNKVT